jgi:hypothetical protein
MLVHEKLHRLDLLRVRFFDREGSGMSNLLSRVSVLAWALFLGNAAPACHGEDPWEPYRFLIGKWTGEGAGGPGQGKGEFSFGFELNDKILVRKNHAEYPAAAGRSAVVHDDLMVIYQSEDHRPANAIYFDNEGHVIHYAATFSDDRRTLTFVSAASATGPRYRLSYIKDEDGVVRIRFEIAPPGKPDGFKAYLEGRARRTEARTP